MSGNFSVSKGKLFFLIAISFFGKRSSCSCLVMLCRTKLKVSINLQECYMVFRTIRGGMDSKGCCLVRCPKNPFQAFRVPRYKGCTHVPPWHIRCHWIWAGVRANGVMLCWMPLSGSFWVQGSGEYLQEDDAPYAQQYDVQLGLALPISHSLRRHDLSSTQISIAHPSATQAFKWMIYVANWATQSPPHRTSSPQYDAGLTMSVPFNSSLYTRILAQKPFSRPNSWAPFESIPPLMHFLQGWSVTISK